MSLSLDSAVRPPGVNIQLVIGHMGLQLRSEARVRSVDLVVIGEKG